MTDSDPDPDPDTDPKLDKALSELLAQVERESISPRLRKLAERLEAVLNRRRSADQDPG